MIYVIGAVTACLGLGAGIVIGFMVAVGREARVSLEELMCLEDEALRAEARMQGNPTPANARELSTIRKRLRREARKAVAAEARRARVERIRVRAGLMRKWL